MTNPKSPPQPAVSVEQIDPKAEYAAFKIWAARWFWDCDPPAVTSHLFDAWMGSARHRASADAPADGVLREALEAIMASRYGLQAIQEDYGHDTNAYNFQAMKYWAAQVQEYRSIAMHALSVAPKAPTAPIGEGALHEALNIMLTAFAAYAGTKAQKEACIIASKAMAGDPVEAIPSAPGAGDVRGALEAAAKIAATFAEPNGHPRTQFDRGYENSARKIAARIRALAAQKDLSAAPPADGVLRDERAAITALETYLNARQYADEDACIDLDDANPILMVGHLRTLLNMCRRGAFTGDPTDAMLDAPGADGLREALASIADDYMTSENHHPGYVLIPTAKFEQLHALADRAQGEGEKAS